MRETRFRVLAASWALLILSACSGDDAVAPMVSPESDTDANIQPNVVLFSLDTFRADRVNQAPFVSELISQGLTAPRTWSSSNWTLPAHMSLLTSTHPIEHDTPRAGSRLPYSGEGVRPGMATLAEAYQSAGYTTVASTDGGFVGTGFGFEKGFDHYASAQEGEARDSFDHHFRVLEDLLKERDGRPFFLFLHTYKIHDYFLNTPDYHDFVDPEVDRESIEHGSWLDEIKRGTAPKNYVSRLYDSGIRVTDSFVRQVVERLEDATAGENLLVVITSDHGESLGANNGLWHHGRGLWEEQLRVPLVVWGNYELAPKGIVDQPVSLVDVAPSLLSISDLDVPEGFSGRSDVFEHSSDSNTDLATGRPMIQASRVHTGPNLAQSHVGQALIQSGRKYFREDTFEGKTRIEKCFDLAVDPQETQDLLSRSRSSCSTFPAVLAGKIQESVEPALFVRGVAGSRVQLELSDPEQLRAVRTASGSRSKIVSPETGALDWVPQSPQDVLAIILADPQSLATIHVRVNGETLNDSLALSSIGMVGSPTSLGVSTNSLSLSRSLGGARLDVSAEPDDELIRHLRALGYTE